MMRVILLLFFLPLLEGCINSKQNEIIETGTSLNELWNGKDINLLLDSFNIKNINSNNFLVYLDGNCGECFEELEIYRQRIFKIFHKKANFYFIFTSNDQKITEHYLKKREFNDSLYRFDNKKLLSSQLPFMISEKIYNTVLFDNKGKIIFIGSPIVSANILKHYQSIIR